MSQPRPERASLLSPILSVTALVGSGLAFAYIVVASLTQLR